MENWVDVLRDARHSLASLDPPQSSSEAAASQLPAGLRILRSLAEGTVLSDLENICFNLDTAAMYLVRMLSETPDPGHLVEIRGGNFTDDVIAYR